MINSNGTFLSSEVCLSASNRGFLYGDGIFETLKVVNNKILFFEDHYFRLMASMRIVRMQIPGNFTLEFLEEQILSTASKNNCAESARIRLTIYRNNGGFYTPETKTTSYIIQAFPLATKLYTFLETSYEVDLYKDFFIAKQLLSTIKSTNKMINITGSIFAQENDLQNCLLLNNEKNVVEALNGNIFMLLGHKLVTPPIEAGCLNGIVRKQVLAVAKKIEGLDVLEESISPFDLQKAEELFITNVIIGIQPITQYRKKAYTTKLANELFQKLNELI